MSWVTSRWLSVSVSVYISYEKPIAARHSDQILWYRRAMTSGSTPSSAALSAVGVPCMSLPETMMASLPASR